MEEPPVYKPHPVIGVGMPASMHLDLFGSVVWDAFGSPPYLVGTAARGKQWRDVDVRLILADEEFDALFGVGGPQQSSNGKWASLCMAYSALAEKMTGLPVDFQIQRQTQANEQHPGLERCALGLIGVRMTE